MKLGVYSMRDSVAGLYQQPTFELNEGTAVRNFKFAINHTDFYKFAASNVDLYKIGIFDNETGVLEHQDPVMILSGVSALENGNV